MGFQTLKKIVAVISVTAVLVACGSNGSSYLGGATSKEGTVKELVRNVGDRVFFSTDSSTLNASSRATLQKQADWLKSNSVTLTIQGHADERGTRDYNLALGARRANSVRDYMVSLGVNPRRLATISYGKERPVSLCAEESCWSKNRRSVSVAR